MKKICLCCALLFCVSFGLFAGAAEDREFRQYVENTKQSPTNPQGMTVAADYNKRIIYSAITIPHIRKLTEAERKQLKNMMLQNMKSDTKEISLVKRLKISFVFVFTTDSKDIITVAISPNEL